MGSVFKQGESKAVSQPSVAPTTYINEIAGYEQVPVKNEDGSITYITRQLELSAEEKLKKAELEKIANDALSEIQNISSEDYVASEATQQLLNDWQATQMQSLDSSFDKTTEINEDRLAKRGLADSTAADTTRRQIAQDEYDAGKQIEREKSSIATSLRQTELNNQQNLYNLAQSQLNYDKAQTLSSTSGNLSAINAMNATNRASINDYYANSGNAQTDMFINNILDPISQAAGDSASGALSTGVDGFISTITGGF